MNQAGVVTEVVWYNFAIDRLHWSRHAGDTPNQRQDVKRKAERWARRYQAMPQAERIAMLGRSWRWRRSVEHGQSGDSPVGAEERV